MKKKVFSAGALLLATVIWGSAFVAQRVGMDHIGPFTFQAVRCALGALILLPMIALFDLNKKSSKNFFSRWKDKTLWKAGLLAAIPLFLAVNLQQLALVTTDSGKSAFLTAMYIVIVPIIGLLMGKKPPITIPISVLLAVGGLYFLCWNGKSGIRSADLCLLGCAVCFAVQITVIDHYVNDVDPLRLSFLQSLFCAAFSAVVMFATEAPNITAIAQCWLPLGYAGIMSMGIAYSLQILGQRHLEPARASLIMSLESVFSAVAGWLILQETMNGSMLMGCALVFAAVILSQIEIKRK